MGWGRQGPAGLEAALLERTAELGGGGGIGLLRGEAALLELRDDLGDLHPPLDAMLEAAGRELVQRAHGRQEVIPPAGIARAA